MSFVSLILDLFKIQDMTLFSATPSRHQGADNRGYGTSFPVNCLYPEFLILAYRVDFSRLCLWPFVSSAPSYQRFTPPNFFHRNFAFQHEKSLAFLGASPLNIFVWGLFSSPKASLLKPMLQRRVLRTKCQMWH